jgi:hypothetical protein
MRTLAFLFVLLHIRRTSRFTLARTMSLLCHLDKLSWQQPRKCRRRSGSNAQPETGG